MGYTHIKPGCEIEVSAHIYPNKADQRVAELVKLSRTELIALENASAAREEAIFAQFSELEKQWLKQAAETVAIRQAKQYLNVLSVNHTFNQWKQDQYENYEISNMVYKMTYRIYEQTRYDRALQKSVTTAWELSWNIHYNTVHHPDPDMTGSGWQIAGQSRKRFVKKEDMEKYLNGRIAAYAHLFTEISPPIPSGQKGRFCVNGVLLPGYTVEVPVEERAEELLSFLDDDPFPAKAPASPDTHQSETFQKEETPVKQELHTTSKNQHRNREPVQKPETARKGPKKPPRRKTAPAP